MIELDFDRQKFVDALKNAINTSFMRFKVEFYNLNPKVSIKLVWSRENYNVKINLILVYDNVTFSCNQISIEFEKAKSLRSKFPYVNKVSTQKQSAESQVWKKRNKC